MSYEPKQCMPLPGLMKPSYRWSSTLHLNGLDSKRWRIGESKMEDQIPGCHFERIFQESHSTQTSKMDVFICMNENELLFC